MQRSIYAHLLLLLGVAISFAGCKKDPEPVIDGLTGTWQLASRQCYCTPGPVPSETLFITASGFALLEKGQFTASGTYTFTTATICGSQTPAPALGLTATTGAWHRGTPVFQLTGNELVLDYGSPCDALRDTYRRRP